MKLDEFLARHPDAILANNSHNEELLRFFSTSQMDGESIAIAYDRSPDFFRFLKFSSPEYYVFCTRDKKKQIAAVGTLIIRDGYINGGLCKVGYFGDLRIKFDRRVALRWRQFYSDLVVHAHMIDDFSHCKHFITAIMDSNKEALLSLVQSKKNQFFYQKLCPYKMINISLRKPFYPRQRTEFKLETGSDHNQAEVFSFFKKIHKSRPFGFNFQPDDPSENQYRLAKWNNFRMNDFLLLRDKNNLIISCCALWGPSPYKKIILKKIPWSLKQLLKLQQIFKASPEVGKELKVLYLTHLNFSDELDENQRNEALEHILEYIDALKIFKNYHFVSLCTFGPWKIEKALKAYLSFSTNLSLYQVVPQDRLEDLLPCAENTAQIPGFEMALV